VGEQPMYHNCASLCSLREGKEGEKTIYISPFFMNYRIEMKMLLIILLGLFTTLTSVSSDCGVGTQGLKVVNFTKVGIVVDMIPETSNFQNCCFRLQFSCVFINRIPKDNIRLRIFD
jgi:hypothetical protein